MLTWWTMPVSGGTTLKLRKAYCPQRRKVYRSWLRTYSIAVFSANAVGVPEESTCTEWSITSSQGTSGLIFAGSPPRAFMASRIAAKSTMQGTPVKSCNSTRAGV